MDIKFLNEENNKYVLGLDKEAILLLTEALLTIEILNYEKNKINIKEFSALDVLGDDWLGGHPYRCVGSMFYRNVFYRLFDDNMKTASQQIGRIFKKAALKLGYQEIKVVYKGTKKSAYVR